MATSRKNQTANDTIENAAPARSRKTGTTANGIIFTKKKTVTVPVLKLQPDTPVYIKVEQKMELSKQIEQKKVGATPMEAATIMHVTDLNTDDEAILIVGKMLKSVIEEAYPNDTYVGKSFEVINHGKRGDKKYNAYSLTEIELDTM